MQLEIISGLFGASGVVLGGLLSWWIQRDRLSADLRIALESVKTEHMAELAVQHYLNHKGYTDRSFKLLQARVGGFEDQELRKVLIRAGAVRYFRADGSEWWRLLHRTAEAGDRARKREADLTANNEDL